MGVYTFYAGFSGMVLKKSFGGQKDFVGGSQIRSLPSSQFSVESDPFLACRGAQSNYRLLCCLSPLASTGNNCGERWGKC